MQKQKQESLTPRQPSTRPADRGRSTLPRHYPFSPPDQPKSVTRFLEAYAATTNPLPGRPGVRSLRFCPFVHFDLGHRDRRVWLTLISTDYPGRGFGRVGLSWLCALADRIGVSLYLTAGRPERLVPQYLSDEALAAWYGRNGFREWGREGGRPVMIRPPRAPPHDPE